MKYTTQEIFDAFFIYGNYSATAKNLGIDPRTVRNHVNRYHEENSVVSTEAHRTGIPLDRVSHYWLKTKNEVGDDVSVFVKNHFDALEYDELRERLVKDMIAYSPKVSKIPRDPNTYVGDFTHKKKSLLVIDPADVHIGKRSVTDETGNEYNMDIAVSRAVHGSKRLMIQAEPFGIDHIVIVVGNDVVHIDNDRRTTTAGTPQDTDGQWWEMFENARRMYIQIVEAAKEYADVTLVYVPSNHDKIMGFGIMDSLYSWYHNDENVIVSNYGKSVRHRKYIKYGKNLIGLTHGDGAKNRDLTSLMQFEAKEDWGSCDFAYWYVHHLHHKYRIVNGIQVEKDYNGVTVIGPEGTNINRQKDSAEVECIRSPSGADAWSSKKGFGNMAAIEGFIHHYDLGQVARLTSYC